MRQRWVARGAWLDYAYSGSAEACAVVTAFVLATTRASVSTGSIGRPDSSALGSVRAVIRRARLLRVEPAFMFSRARRAFGPSVGRRPHERSYCWGGQSVPLRSQRHLERASHTGRVCWSGDWEVWRSAAPVVHGWNGRAVRSRDPVESVVGPPLGAGGSSGVSPRDSPDALRRRRHRGSFRRACGRRTAQRNSLPVWGGSRARDGRARRGL